ncbi:MAG: hypothetical protein AAGE13_12590 [Pseudomonadota bacterium]
MIRLCLAVLAAAVLSIHAMPAGARVVESRQFGNWLYEYNVSRTVTSCVASRYYSNAQFSVRLYGNRMDVVFYRSDFRFRWDARQGTSVIRVRGNTYRLASSTPRRGNATAPRASVLYLTVPGGRYRAFYDDLKRARNLQITLWNNAKYTVDLTGSSRALSAALSCWERNRTGS